MPEYVVRRTEWSMHRMDTRRQSTVAHSHSCLAYELDIDDEPESLSDVLMELLTERGAEVEYHDPNVPTTSPTREHSAVVLMARHSPGIRRIRNTRPHASRGTRSCGDVLRQFSGVTRRKERANMPPSL
jgi:UDP-N-acetyl-D-mannosaminuronate dehydrogenase